MSDWIHSCHNKNKITGFITEANETEITVFVTIPKNYGTIVIKREEAWKADDTVWMDDIPSLIDLSLKIRDKEWFQKWVNELSLWRPVEEVRHYL